LLVGLLACWLARFLARWLVCLIAGVGLTVRGLQQFASRV
jgi:hypothetical protein